MFTSFVRWIKNHDLLTYFVLTFLFTYAAWSVTLLVPIQGDPNTKANFAKTFQFLGMWGPGVAGILTIAVTRGKPGLNDLFRRLFHWRAGLRWYLFILFLWPLLSIVGDYLYAQFTHQTVRVGWSSWSQTMNWLAQAPILAFWASEEIGWRGFALPRLQSSRNALSTSLILGSVWALWHLPLFFMGNSAIVYWIFTVSVTILMTWIMNNNQGSLFLAVFFHFWINVYGSGIHSDIFSIANPDPVLQMGIKSVLMFVVALGVVALYGYRTFTREQQSPLLAAWKPGRP